MNFLLGILEGGGSVDEHPLIQQLLDLFWLLMEVCRTSRVRGQPQVCGEAQNSSLCLQEHEVNECLKQLMMSLLRAYRFSPIIPDLGFQVRPTSCF